MFDDKNIINCHWCRERKLRPWPTLLCSLCHPREKSINVAMPRKEYERISKIQTEIYYKWVEETKPEPSYLGAPIAPDSIYPKMGDKIYHE